MDLQAVTGQLYITNGAVQETTAVPGLLAQSAPPKAARGRQRDSLFIHLSLSGQPEETADLTQNLLDTIKQRYYQSSGSVTAALRRAIIEANQLLLRLNLSGKAPTREGAITCAVLRQGELYTLQAGEALALLGHHFGVERLPPRPPDRTTPLGRTAGVDIRFHHHRLQTGNILLLADPRIAHLPSQTLAPALVDTEVELGLTELATIVGPDSARLLLVEFTDELPADLPEATGASATAETPAAPTAVPTPVRGHIGPAPAAADRRAQPERPSSPRPPRLPQVDLETNARLATSSAAMSLSRFTGWLADLLTRLRPPRSPDEETANWVLPASLAVVIPVIVALVVTTVYVQRGRGQRFAEIKVEMGQNLALAEAAGDDKAAALQHYQAVTALAAEAETIRPGDEEVARLRQQALAEMDRLGDITRLSARAMYTFPETVSLTAVALQEGFNGGIYTLDGNESQVFHHQTDESYLNFLTLDPDRIIFSGQAVGNHVVGNVIDIFWRPQGSAVTREGAAMLDAVGALLTFYPNFSDIRAVPLGLATDWQQPAAVTTFDERLYILDRGANVIWKYFPDGDGFLLKEDERTIAFAENPELNLAVDVAIYSEDGSLVVAYGDGRLRYYDTRSGRIQWNETDLLQNGLTAPLVTPAAVEIVGRGLNASIFVADPGSGRIIQISRGGTVLAQYRASDDDGQELFTRVTDFAVAETPLRLFVTADNVLYLTTQE